MKTPEEIKKGLECRTRLRTLACDCKCAECDLFNPVYLTTERIADALAYIQQLESRLAPVERERDAAVAEIKRMEAKTEELRDMVNDVIHRELPYSDYLDFINQVDQIYNYQFENEWRGPCPENTKE